MLTLQHWAVLRVNGVQAVIRPYRNSSSVDFCCHLVSKRLHGWRDYRVGPECLSERRCLQGLVQKVSPFSSTCTQSEVSVQSALDFTHLI